MSAPTRMEQIGTLLTAMIAVIVTGQSDLLAGIPEPKETRTPLVPILVEFEYRGHLCARVAHRLGLSVRHVREVCRGARTSDRVARALIRAARRAEREYVGRALREEHRATGKLRHGHLPSRIYREANLLYVDPDVLALQLNDEEIAQFSKGGKYCRIVAAALKKFGTYRSLLEDEMLFGRVPRDLILFLRAEMARIDAERAQ